MDRMHVAIVELSYLLKSRVGGYDQKINLLTCDKTYKKLNVQYLLGQSRMVKHGMSTLPGQRSLKEGVTINRSNDRNYVARNILPVTVKGVHLVSVSGLYLVAMGKCLRISNT